MYGIYQKWSHMNNDYPLSLNWGFIASLFYPNQEICDDVQYCIEMSANCIGKLLHSLMEKPSYTCPCEIHTII